MKKLIILLICMIGTLSLIGCGSSLPENFYEDSAIYATSSDSYSMFKSIQNKRKNTYEGKYKFSGYSTIWSYDSDTDKTVEVTYSLKVVHGNGKLVLITGDNNVKTLKEVSSSLVPEKQTVTLRLKKGTNIIKFVGQDAETELTLSAKEGNLKLIGN